MCAGARVCVCVCVCENKKITKSSVARRITILKNKTARALSYGTFQARTPESIKNGNKYIS